MTQYAPCTNRVDTYIEFLVKFSLYIEHSFTTKFRLPNEEEKLLFFKQYLFRAGVQSSITDDEFNRVINTKHFSFRLNYKYFVGIYIHWSVLGN